MFHLKTGKCPTLTSLRPFARHLVVLKDHPLLMNVPHDTHQPEKKIHEFRNLWKRRSFLVKPYPHPSPIGFYHQHFQLNFVDIRGKPFHTTTPPKNSSQFLDTDTSESKNKSHLQLPTTGILVCSTFFGVIGSPKTKDLEVNRLCGKSPAVGFFFKCIKPPKTCPIKVPKTMSRLEFWKSPLLQKSRPASFFQYLHMKVHRADCIKLYLNVYLKTPKIFRYPFLKFQYVVPQNPPSPQTSRTSLCGLPPVSHHAVRTLEIRDQHLTDLSQVKLTWNPPTFTGFSRWCSQCITSPRIFLVGLAGFHLFFGWKNTSDWLNHFCWFDREKQQTKFGMMLVISCAFSRCSEVILQRQWWDPILNNFPAYYPPWN